MSRPFRAASFAVMSLCALALAAIADPSRADDRVMILPGAMVATPAVIAPASFANPIDAMKTALPETGSTEPTPKPRSLVALVDGHADQDVADREQECLAGAIYFEAKSESLEGQLAVAEVIVNRAKSGRFPSSFCSVVFQRSQFSFVRGGDLPPIPRASAAWARAVGIAKIATEGMWEAVAPKALFFHASRVAPAWRNVTRISRIGNHIFYR